MTDPQVLIGRVVGRAIQRGEHIFLLFIVPGRADVPEVRLYLQLDGEVILDPEPPDVGDIDMQKLFYLYDLATLTVSDVVLEPNGDLRIEFTDGTELTAVAGTDRSGWSIEIQQSAANTGA